MDMGEPRTGQIRLAVVAPDLAIPIERRKGEGARSGTLNVGDTFKLTATTSAGESTYTATQAVACPECN
jgi:hypothetical protein